jgi:hypothetical protein
VTGEGGFTPFDCEVTSLLQDGPNFVVIAVDNTRSASGIPTLQTDWWNYGGFTRDVSLVEVPDQFIDDFDLHLKRGSQTAIEGWVNVEGWYEHKPEDAEKIVWKVAHDKPLIISEFGGEAKYGLHGDSEALWTEDYQANIYATNCLCSRASASCEA